MLFNIISSVSVERLLQSCEYYSKYSLIIDYSLQNSVSMEIPDLSSDEGLDFLNKYFKDKSFCFGFSPTKADSLIWEEMKKSPSEKFENLLRWYKHIASYGSERNIFPKANNDIEIHFIKKEKEAQKPPEVNERKTGPCIVFLYSVSLFCC